MKKLLAVLLCCAFSTVLAEGKGLQTLRSAHSVQGTIDRLEAALKSKGMTVFTRIDHAAGAAATGQTLRPTQLLIFGNPKVGTPLMQCGISMAIDLPQKALVWEDSEGAVWLAYNDPTYLADRHALGKCGGVVDKVGAALRNFATQATQP